MKNELIIPGYSMNNDPQSKTPIELTDIQKQIIRLIKKGSSSKEISLITGFGVDLIHSERKILMEKTGSATMYDVMLKLEKYNLS